MIMKHGCLRNEADQEVGLQRRHHHSAIASVFLMSSDADPSIYFPSVLYFHTGRDADALH